MSIVIDAPKARKTVEVTLYGETYRVRPVKIAIAVYMITSIQNLGKDPERAATALGRYLRSAVSEEDAQRIEARLYDPADDLDFEDIISMNSLVVEAQSGDTPTTPPSA